MNTPEMLEDEERSEQLTHTDQQLAQARDEIRRRIAEKRGAVIENLHQLESQLAKLG